VKHFLNSYLEWTYSKVYGATDAKNIIHNGQVIYQPPQQPNHFALKTPSSLEINKIKRTESGMIVKVCKYLLFANYRM